MNNVLDRRNYIMKKFIKVIIKHLNISINYFNNMTFFFSNQTADQLLTGKTV